MYSKKIRRGFAHFFQNQDHTLVPSSPVVPHNDPTLLFTNAGMNQFKDIFLGRQSAPYRRAATCQKCVRVGGKHNDLENVGHTARHLTFFEMLGNFSFGDYFKEKAIELAWTMVKEVLEFDLDKIWISVHTSDDEAFELWKRFVPEKRIVRLGDKDNFWSMGASGPCGPCSELYYDRGREYGSIDNLEDDPDGERFLEFWNLVFMQFNRSEDGQVKELPKGCIDTGAGLERLVALKMGVDNLFEIDTFTHLIDQIHQIAPKAPKTVHPPAASRVIADHLRLLCFAISDGVQPSNLDRGYILRKVLRRAIRYGRDLGFHAPFMASLVPQVIELMGEDYPELSQNKERIEEILTLEEESFWKTLKRGGRLLQDVCDRAKAESRPISGSEAFKLKDTYGMPYDEISLLAKDCGLSVNEKEYTELELEAKERSRSTRDKHHQAVARGVAHELEQEGYTCSFTGYHELQTKAQVLAIIQQETLVQEAKPGDEVEILVSQTPFYAEKGGQLADHGEITDQNGLQARITDCQNPLGQIILHKTRIVKGKICVGQELLLKVDSKRREEIACHHSATHLLHWGLIEVLGEHVQQKGSLVAPNYLRFDFSHHKPLSREEIVEIETRVNAKIRENLRVKTYEKSYKEVQGDTKIKQFFGDKYGESVRVVDMEFATELCGGTHVSALGEIGSIQITKENSIAAGIRRIEAVAAGSSIEYMQQCKGILEQVYAKLKAPEGKLLEQLDELFDQSIQYKKTIELMQKRQLANMVQEAKEKTQILGKIPFTLLKTSIEPKLVSQLIQECNAVEGAVLIVNKSQSKVQIAMRLDQKAQGSGLHAGKIIGTLAPIINGKGGGRPESAQAGGDRVEAIHELVEKAKQILIGS